MKLFIVVNVDWFFLSHRLPVALAAKAAGYDVTIVTCDTGRADDIRRHGLGFIHVPFERSGTNMKHEMRCLRILYRLYKRHQPDVLHHVTIKVALYGSIAARLTRMKGIVNAISGLGYNFTGGRKGITQKVLMSMMRFGFKGGNRHFIFQNEDDVNVFKSLRIVRDEDVTLIKGSGVDLQEFTFDGKPVPNGRIKVVLPARMLRDKGVMEFINAAKLLKPELIGKAVFILAGDVDHENLAAISAQELGELTDGDYIKWIGYQKNVQALLKECDLVVLPSYREGLPKSLIEAAAVGRPIVTTDVPGCRECVVPEYNGLLVPARDEQALADAMYRLISNEGMRVAMGANSRKLAEREFGVDQVIAKTLHIYKSLAKVS
ncbi:glycosyltransferase family 4 protein [Chitinophaga vietnamensis]|uniref:glycosyltransferase family 4 protein n=1 Tax=Chitinophaga vietnamensis TaxID=2593957 RepID=UPI00191BED4D|nr:glycosyltransferase family 4 protein [Chitinophaga vietnamensis]